MASGSLKVKSLIEDEHAPVLAELGMASKAPQAAWKRELFHP